MKTKEIKLLFEIITNPNLDLLNFTDNELITLGLSNDDIKIKGTIGSFTSTLRAKCIDAFVNHCQEQENRIKALENQLLKVNITL